MSRNKNGRFQELDMDQRPANTASPQAIEVHTTGRGTSFFALSPD
jgi:hypothetical protein